eukprot:TRINITY_DN920_c0_g1_i1.p1 TRINITY_DN920_c0_g1~~TRINITY_DN920_c0_g1_i1.p1  ORF type:complete len:917 (-),score=149.72 TRINITY_DN920_c0_g1_i1:137-2887(-)
MLGVDMMNNYGGTCAGRSGSLGCSNNGAAVTAAVASGAVTGDESAVPSFNERFSKLIRGHWLDSIGNSIIVSRCTEEDELKAVLTPLVDHPDARDRVLSVRLEPSRAAWRCGNASLEWADVKQERLVWATEDGRRSVWSRMAEWGTAPNADGSPRSTNGDDLPGRGTAFPWLLNNAIPEPWLPLDVPRDILYDGARIAALLDIRQLIGAKSEPQERLTHLLMDHDLQPLRGDYLIPGVESPLWQKLPVSEGTRRSIEQRISRIPHEALSQRVSWSGNSEVWVGHHKISVRTRDVQALESRWALHAKDPRKPLEIARLLALYSVFDNPLSNRRNGVHLGLDPELRRQCDYELFASPLNAAVANGRFASKWPHIECNFGSIGSYPSVLSVIPPDSIVCVNPPFTDAYLEDVMARISDLKSRFRLRVAVPIQEASWRKHLQSSLPSAQLLKTYYDASLETSTDVLHPTLLWEDPRCPVRTADGSGRRGLAGLGLTSVPLLPATSSQEGPPVLMGMTSPEGSSNNIQAVAFYELPRVDSGSQHQTSAAAAVAASAAYLAATSMAVMSGPGGGSCATYDGGCGARCGGGGDGGGPCGSSAPCGGGGNSAGCGGGGSDSRNAEPMQPVWETAAISGGCGRAAAATARASTRAAAVAAAKANAAASVASLSPTAAGESPCSLGSGGANGGGGGNGEDVGTTVANASNAGVNGGLTIGEGADSKGLSGTVAVSGGISGSGGSGHSGSARGTVGRAGLRGSPPTGTESRSPPRHEDYHSPPPSSSTRRNPGSVGVGAGTVVGASPVGGRSGGAGVSGRPTSAAPHSGGAVVPSTAHSAGASRRRQRPGAAAMAAAAATAAAERSALAAQAAADAAAAAAAAAALASVGPRSSSCGIAKEQEDGVYLDSREWPALSTTVPSRKTKR